MSLIYRADTNLFLFKFIFENFIIRCSRMLHVPGANDGQNYSGTMFLSINLITKIALFPILFLSFRLITFACFIFLYNTTYGEISYFAGSNACQGMLMRYRAHGPTNHNVTNLKGSTTSARRRPIKARQRGPLKLVIFNVSQASILALFRLLRSASR